MLRNFRAQAPGTYPPRNPLSCSTRFHAAWILERSGFLEDLSERQTYYLKQWKLHDVLQIHVPVCVCVCSVGGLNGHESRSRTSERERERERQRKICTATTELL